MKDIYEGVADGLTTSQCDAYRQLWGPLPLSGVVATAVQHRPPIPPKQSAVGVGTILEQLFADWTKWLAIDEPDIDRATLETSRRQGRNRASDARDSPH